jgi:hypothetical protein
MQHTFTTLAATAALTLQVGCSVDAPINDRAEHTAKHGQAIESSNAQPQQAAQQQAGNGSSGSASSGNTSSATQAKLSTILPWGNAEGEAGLRPQAFETMAQGPNAIGVAADGAPLLLDRLNGRVLRVEPSGRVQSIASVPVDAEDLSVAPDGIMAAFSPLRATAWMYHADGSPLGELRVPRSFRELMGLDIGASNRLVVRTAYQERYDIGSHSAPMQLPVTLRTKREGAYELPSGHGIAMRIVDGQPAMLLTKNAEDRSVVDRTIAIARSASAARLVGTFGTIACMRLELVSSTPKMSVTRSALCIDTDDRRVVFEQALPKRGLYLPRRELSLGAAGHLAFMHPTETGLTVTTWEVQR